MGVQTAGSLWLSSGDVTCSPVANSTVLHTWKLLREPILNVVTTKK